jgi:hypothetical protein
VEVSLQNHWAQRLVGDATTDFRLIDKEEVNGVRALRYECIREEDGEKTRTVVWMHPETGLPVRSADYVTEAGNERLSSLYDRIETNVPPPRTDMFSFQPPEGYTLKHETAEANAPFVRAMASAGGRQSAARETIAIDDRAILICWMNQPRPDADPQPANAEPDPLKIKLELTGSPAKRPCSHFPIREQQDQDQLWHWSLVVPRDRKPLIAGEYLAVTFKTKKSQMGFSNYPLHFEEERLAKLLMQLQTETFSEQPADETPFTLADLRKQISQVLAQPVDDDEPESPEP